uniref:RRP15-like protein n=1 Tax=Trichogramma kaykai TaxID=54128 RepID=A0ABD2WN46_9HYME
MSEQEQRILRELVKSREAIRRKALMLKRGRDETEKTVTETFNPIIKPLSKLVTLTEEKSHPVNKKLKNKLTQQTAETDQTLKDEDLKKSLITDDEYTPMTEDEED